MLCFFVSDGLSCVFWLLLPALSSMEKWFTNVYKINKSLLCKVSYGQVLWPWITAKNLPFSTSASWMSSCVGSQHTFQWTFSCSFKKNRTNWKFRLNFYFKSQGCEKRNGLAGISSRATPHEAEEQKRPQHQGLVFKGAGAGSDMGWVPAESRCSQRLLISAPDSLQTLHHSLEWSHFAACSG